MSELALALEELLEVVNAAIKSGDWKIDGACDPDLAIQYAEQELSKHYELKKTIYKVYEDYKRGRK